MLFFCAHNTLSDKHITISVVNFERCLTMTICRVPCHASATHLVGEDFWIRLRMGLQHDELLDGFSTSHWDTLFWCICVAKNETI